MFFIYGCLQIRTSVFIIALPHARRISWPDRQTYTVCKYYAKIKLLRIVDLKCVLCVCVYYKKLCSRIYEIEQIFENLELCQCELVAYQRLIS